MTILTILAISFSIYIIILIAQTKFSDLYLVKFLNNLAKCNIDKSSLHFFHNLIGWTCKAYKFFVRSASLSI